MTEQEKILEQAAIALEAEADRIRSAAIKDDKDGFVDVAQRSFREAETWEAAARCARSLMSSKNRS